MTLRYVDRVTSGQGILELESIGKGDIVFFGVGDISTTVRPTLPRHVGELGELRKDTLSRRVQEMRAGCR